MDSRQLTQGLHQAFFSENHRLVFWYDPEQSFADELSSLELPGIQVLQMDRESALGVKIRLELEDKGSNYLLYFPYSEPEPEHDWLLDIKLYSRVFYADRISLIFNELKLQNHSLRTHLAKRRSFLTKGRVDSLKRHVQADFGEEELDLAMVAVLTRAQNPDVATIIFTLADQLVEQGEGLEAELDVFRELEKFELTPTLVKSLQREVGYPASQEELTGEAPFNFGRFLICLLTTGFCESISDIPDWARSVAMPSTSARATSRALLSRWRDSSRFYPAYDVVSGWVSQALDIKSRIAELPMNTLAGVATFHDVEERLIIDLAKEIPAARSADLHVFERIIGERLDSYWASRHKNDETRKRYRTMYAALSSAIALFALRQTYDEGFHYQSSEALYKAYAEDLYRFDTAYRHYCCASREASVELLKSLDEAVEQCYSNWYLEKLATNWGELVEQEERVRHWHLPGTPSQQDFYDRWVRDKVEGGRSRRLVVIISDAFRYEAAEELKQRINEKRYSEAELGSQLGVLPSYTTLGMAALMPHKSLDYRQDASGDVLVDGKSSQGIENRSKILGEYGGIAVKAETVRAWSRDEGREALRDQELVYVFHNVVDARGDSASTESETFNAVERAIDELTELTRKIIMHFNTATVLVTADHGFLFQHSHPEVADRTSLIEKPGNAFKSKKRYVIGHDLPESDSVWHGSTRNTAGTQSETQFWIPKGMNRFHFVGGARFVHGGAMPQEVVVPVLTVQQLRGEKAERRTRRKVEVISSKPSLRMVNNIQRFDLMQTEPVSDQVMPVTLAVGIYEGDEIVSSEEVVTFDSDSDSMSERVKQVRLSLSGTNFDRKKEYALVLKDKSTGVECGRYRVVIDLAFTDDFF